jgi:hypothetical protein
MNSEPLGNIEANKILEQVRREEKNKEQRTNDDTIKLEQAESLVRRIVYDNSNPNPVLIAGIFAGIMIVIWFIYVMMIKPNASGEWYDDKGNRWDLDHYRMGGITALVRGKLVNCTLSDNMFKCGNMMGIWNYSDVIILVGGGNLTRVHEMREEA